MTAQIIDFRQAKATLTALREYRQQRHIARQKTPLLEPGRDAGSIGVVEASCPATDPQLLRDLVKFAKSGGPGDCDAG